MTPNGNLRSLWSATDFPGEALTTYARDLMGDETQRGLVILSLLCFTLFGGTALASLYLSLGASFTYTYSLLAVLSLHIGVSARITRGMRNHRLMGMALLVICATAIVLLAHRMGEVDPMMFATIALLFMVVPAVPWGLREASFVLGAIYFIFTVSTGSISGPFPSETLWALQFFMLSCALISLVLVVRTVGIRKQDIAVRFELERARGELEFLAHRDPLTGTLNRRSLEPAFRSLAQRCAQERAQGWFCALDIDHFKQINDSRGHAIGDQVLVRVVRILQQLLLPGESLLRTGGDEFVLLLRGSNPLPRIHAAMVLLATRPELEPDAIPVALSAGLNRLAPGAPPDLEQAYRSADRALYEAKQAPAGKRIVEYDAGQDARLNPGTWPVPDSGGGRGRVAPTA